MLVKILKKIFIVIIGLALIWITYRILFFTLQKDEISKKDLQLTEPKGLSGTFQVSLIGINNSSKKPLEHISIFSRDSHYRNMEDNDLRGFLDGHFKNGWNQPSQVHVRVGRRGASKYRELELSLLRELIEIPFFSHILRYVEPSYPYLGEHELFRILYRWDNIYLPNNSVVKDATFELSVEQSPKKKTLVYLYSVNKDWNPGKGGIYKDNTSPPAKGEVWWNDVSYGERSWGLPGANFASDLHAQADTPQQPLASSFVSPSDLNIVFYSEKVTDYIDERIRSEKPLLFMLKLSDYLEDTPNSRFSIYAANYGDDRNTQKRPKLVLKWGSKNEIKHIAEEITLEYGRDYLFPKISIDGANSYHVSFLGKSGLKDPFIQVRGGKIDNVSVWGNVDGNIKENWDWIQFKITAVEDNPIVLGNNFKERIRDTWITSGSVESQKVDYFFISPSGKIIKVSANFVGDFEWQIKYQPYEIGRWRYFWQHEFTGDITKSSIGVFDVIGGNKTNLLRQLKLLIKEMRESNLLTHYERMERFEVRFIRLQRAIMGSHSPESFYSMKAQPFKELLDEARSLFWQDSIPKKLPLKAYKRK